MRDDVKQSLEEWDAGTSVYTISMGGLGPGYEQAIQILVMELLRDDQPHNDRLLAWGDVVISRIDKAMGGYTGAQVGAARNLAARVMTVGWAAAIKEVSEDRLILVSTRFPDAARARP